MPVMRKFGFWASVVALVLASCTSSTDVDIGSLKVSVTTSGADPDPDGYTIRIADRPGQPIGINGELTVTELLPGTYPVSLTGLAAQCFTDGSPTITVPVKAGLEAAATFTVTCSAANAYVRVTTQTTGSDLDLDGYLVKIGSAPARRVLAQGVINLGSPEEGQVALELSDVATHCTPDAGNPATVSAVRGQPNPVIIRVACAPITGALEVAVVTSGADEQEAGFLVLVNGTPLTLDAANQGATRLPAGSYSVALDGNSVQSNCQVTDGSARTVSVTVGGTTRVTFAVTCVALARVVTSVSTTGPNPDVDGYVVTLYYDDYYRPILSTFSVGANGNTTSPVTLPATYQVSVAGIAANCRLVSATPNPIVVATIDVALSIAVQCIVPRQLAYVGWTLPSDEIFVATENGSATQLTRNAVADSNPTWSPDGSRLAFTSVRDGNNEIYLMNANGSDVRRLTNSVTADYQPSWSSDGARIAFVSERDGNPEIYVMSADGSNPVRLTSDPGADKEPDWSPSGNRILFASNRSSPAAAGIHVMNADGSGVVRLTSGSAIEASPAWSPSGTQVAFVRTINGLHQLHVMNASGTSVSPRNAYAVESTSLSWGLDDRIAFAAVRCDAWYGCYYYAWGVDVLQPDGTVASLPFEYSRDPEWRP